ncbi:hypothetical protein ACVXZY_04780 [Staphylococcus aureus]
MIVITTNIQRLKIEASGLDVGLPEGQMGNSEVGQYQYRCRTYRLSKFNSNQ